MLYNSVSVFNKKMGKEFGLLTKGFYSWANIRQRTTRFMLHFGPIEEHRSKPSAVSHSTYSKSLIMSVEMSEEASASLYLCTWDEI